MVTGGFGEAVIDPSAVCVALSCRGFGEAVTDPSAVDNVRFGYRT